MPKLGLTMAEGTVLAWHVRPGEPVASGTVLLTVSSEKAEVEVEAFATGVLAAVYVAEGETVPVGTLLGAIAGAREPFDAAAFRTSFVPAVDPAAHDAAASVEGRAAAAARHEPARRAAPAARALARRLGIELAAVAGSGPGGRITVEDVERAVAGFVTVNGARLAASVDGAGPALLLVNGFAVDATAWQRQVGDLARDHTVITYDHRGTGRSAPLAGAVVTIAGLAADAHALLRHLGHTPAVVAGASMGAAVALELALNYPDAVRGLVLITPVIARDARLELVLRAWTDTDAPGAERRVRGMLPWMLGRTLLADAGRAAAAAQALRAMLARTSPPTLGCFAEALIAWLGTRTDALARITVPALVVAGEDDVLAPPATAATVAGGLPDGRLEVLAGAGHSPMLERADAVNALVRDFARGGRAGAASTAPL